MDIKFLTHFNEVAQDNFVAIAKQNLVFQAQIKYLDEEVKKIPGLLETISGLEETKKEVAHYIEEITDLKNQLNNKDNIIRASSNTDAERHRIQTALNTQAKELDALSKRVEKLSQENETQKEYITQLEEMLPKSAKKKLGITIPEAVVVTEEVVEVETIKEEVTDKKTKTEDDVVLKVQSAGGTF